MKLSLATSLLLLSSSSSSIPTVLSFSPSNSLFTRTSITGTTGASSTTTSTTTQLKYQEDKSSTATPDNVDVDDAVVDMSSVVARVSVDEYDSQLVESIAFSLGMDETFLMEQYQAWAIKYGKNTVETTTTTTANNANNANANNVRYFNWKRNFLMQEVWNKANEETWEVNEFADMTKQEFDEKFNHMKAGDDDVDNTVDTIVDHDLVEAVSLADAAHAFHFDENGSNNMPNNNNNNNNNTPSQKAMMFKQVRTFSGGFRLVPCTQNDSDTAADAAAAFLKANQLAAETTITAPTRATPPTTIAPPAARSSSSSAGLFRKVAILKTREGY